MGRWYIRLVLAAAGLVPFGIDAQAIRPLIAEFDRPTTASFEVNNPSLFPVTVVVEPWAFVLDREGRAEFGSLPPDVEVRFSETSFQVPPRTTHIVYYEIRAKHTPLWFTIYATIVGPTRPAESGLRLRLRLPHTVYVYGDALERDDVSVSEVRFDRETAEVVALVENASERLGRVRWAEARAGGSMRESPGFPLLPGGARTVRVPWTADERPTSLTLHLDGFEVVVPVPAGAPERQGA
ncbi:MAG TPA: hypothetical protein VGB42_11660 [Candidatus Thermoplasmatota archaeon]